MSNHRRPWFGAMIVVMTAVLVAGCASKDDKDGETPMRTMTTAEGQKQVRDHATAIAATFGTTALDHETRIGDVPCSNAAGDLADDGTVYTQGNYQIPLEPSRHREALQKLRDQWQEQGYTIKELKNIGEVEASLTVSSLDRIQIVIQSTRPPQALALVILTECYKVPSL